MRKLFLSLLFIFAVNLPIAIAQNYSAGLSIEGGFPQGSFKHNVESNGIGIEGIMTVNMPSSPVSAGLDIGFYTYGTDRRKEVFNPNIPEVLLGVRTNNNIFTVHFFTRLQSREGPLRPYMDALVGLNYLFTESSVTDDDEFDELASTTNFDDTALSYGLRGGVQVKVADYVDDTGPALGFYIDLKARYLVGGRAEYLKEGALQNNNGRLEYTTSRSKTDLLSVGLGVVVTF
ncbi:MAG: hypothetical protein U5K69_15970 [Balneolaceae bacterium]|nr:hypothetical protein [Balneolaceae bacterium]